MKTCQTCGTQVLGVEWHSRASLMRSKNTKYRLLIGGSHRLLVWRLSALKPLFIDSFQAGVMPLFDSLV